MPAIKYTKTPVNTDGAWDSSKAVAAIPKDANASTLRKEFAWVDGEADADAKNAYKFSHHFVKADGIPGEASAKACIAAIDLLNGGHGGTDIPAKDRQAIYNHLAAHLKDAKLEAPQLNGLDTSTTHKQSFRLEENSFVADDATGTLNFPMGQPVSDDTIQRSGTHYDIESMDLGEFNGTVTADHEGTIGSIVAKTKLVKRGNQVIMNSLKFCVNEDPFAQIAYDKYKNGYAKDFSIESYGPPPDETGLMVNSKVTGLSCVVTGNNKTATMNEFDEVIRNSLATAKKNGLDITEAEEALGVKLDEHEEEEVINKEDDMKYKTFKNSREFAIKLTYKNAAGDSIETELAPGASFDASEDQAEAIDKAITDAKDPAENQDLQSMINSALEAQSKKFETQLETFQKNMLDKSVKEPVFKPTDKEAIKKAKSEFRNKDVNKELNAMDWQERTVKQIESARLFLTNNSLDGLKALNDINNFHLEELKEKDIVKNSVDLSGFGNFVTSPELLTEIEGTRSDYTPLVDAVGFKETLSLEMAWLSRNGDIEMEEVGLSESDDPDNVKPISQYSATPKTAKLMEVAAVTPVSNAATRFLAVDLLSDVAEGYRTSYQRKLAQIVVARLQQAVNTTGNKTPYTLTAAVEGLISIVDAVKRIANVTANGTFVMSVSTELELFAQQMRANLTGDTLGLFKEGPSGMTFMSRPYIVMPDDVLPALNSGDTKSFIVEGTTVTVDQAIFYADLSTISGRVSGGLNYSLSTDAAYEDGDTVKSAFSRDELVLRGFFFRNAQVRNTAKVGSVFAAGIS